MREVLSYLSRYRHSMRSDPGAYAAGIARSLSRRIGLHPAAAGAVVEVLSDHIGFEVVGGAHREEFCVCRGWLFSL
jgi:hypothetical protein